MSFFSSLLMLVCPFPIESMVNAAKRAQALHRLRMRVKTKDWKIQEQEDFSNAVLAQKLLRERSELERGQ